MRPSENIVINVIDSQGGILNVLNAPKDFLIDNPYNVNIGRLFLETERPMTLDRFFEVSNKLIQDAQEREGVNSKVQLVEEYPPENMSNYGDEVITFKVVERKPGMMNTKGTGRPHRKATYSHQEITPELPNKVITIESRPVDHVIEFNCWGTSNKIVNKRAIWLEKLFINSAFVFEKTGAERFFWKERLSDTYMTVGNQRIFSRPIRFFLRFREFDAKADSIIRRILIDIEILPKK
jgi:hypothetical protein